MTRFGRTLEKLYKEITVVRKLTLSLIITVFCLTTFFTSQSRTVTVEAATSSAQTACLLACAREFFQALGECRQLGTRAEREACAIAAARDAIRCALACRN